MDIAEDQAKERLNETLREMISKIADEMIETVEEYEP